MQAHESSLWESAIRVTAVFVPAFDVFSPFLRGPNLGNYIRVRAGDMRVCWSVRWCVLAFLFCLSLLSAHSGSATYAPFDARPNIRKNGENPGSRRIDGSIEELGIHLAKRCVSSLSNRAGKWASKSFNSFLFLFKIRINPRMPNSVGRICNLDRHIYSRDIYFQTCRDFTE